MTEQIQHLLGAVDWIAVGTTVIGFIAGFSFIKSKISKAENLIHMLHTLFEDLEEAGADGNYSKDEIKKIAEDGKALIEVFFKGKKQ